jgi:hypothetical protein
MKKISLFVVFILCGFLNPINVYSQSSTSLSKKKSYFLIAHRGGIVDSINTPNSRPSIEAAIRKGYNMVEVDLRLTKDNVFIIQHDPTFKRFYGADKPVSSITWDGISKLRSSRDDSKVLRFEDVLKICKGKIQLMIDNKIRGKHPVLFTKLVALLRKYDLLNHAIMIGTKESTPFFTGKIKISCTRKQLEDYMKKPDYKSSNYYLFSDPENLSVSDIKWAKKNNIQIVVAVNRFRYYNARDPIQAAKKDIKKMMREGVTYFQIDSEFEAPFFK